MYASERSKLSSSPSSASPPVRVKIRNFSRRKFWPSREAEEEAVSREADDGGSDGDWHGVRRASDVWK